MTTAPLKTIPLLENGDRLTRYEFERRYTAMPPQTKGNPKAELIEGIVYMASPLRIRSHGQPHSQIVTWLGFYQANRPSLIVGIEPTVRLDMDNEPQPDAVLFIPGRGATIVEDDHIAGAPELVVEISASTVSIDLIIAKPQPPTTPNLPESLLADRWSCLAPSSLPFLVPNHHR